MIPKRFKKNFLDALFPVFCYSCQKEGNWLCYDCQKEQKILDFQVCPVCEGSITEKGSLCFFCRKNKEFQLDGLIVTVPYENPTVKKLVHAFKYRFVADISRSLAVLLAKALIRNEIRLPDYLVPVPLHTKRLRWRGYNQSLLLAKNISFEIAPLSGIPILEIIARKKHNSPQMSIKKYQDRLENVRDIFSLAPDLDPEIVRKKEILLIDDIATTGATLEECAKVLKEAGARRVMAAVIARQSLKK